jgi:leader peptidase (prepilin peptidase)/N-methyltransferase
MPVNPALLLQYTLFIGALGWAAISDARTKTVPILCLIILALPGLVGFSPGNLYGLLLAAPFFIATRFKRGGDGDAWLVAAASLTLGLPGGIAALIIGLSAFCLFVFFQRLRGKGRPGVSYPLVPFLASGMIAALFL